MSENSYMDYRRCVDRLKKDYEVHKNLIVAFDFDNTIFDYHFQKINLDPVKSLLSISNFCALDISATLLLSVSLLLIPLLRCLCCL